MNARRRLTAGGIGLGALTAIASAFPLQDSPPQEQESAPPPVRQVDPRDQGHGGHDHGGVHEPGVEAGSDEEGTQIRVPIPDMDEAQQEMIRLFGRVERNLRKIDVLLSDAGAGDTEALANVGEAGIGLLLNRSLDSGRETLKDIDRILELAGQMSPPPSECPDCAAGT